jgi:hypothetical protein
MDRSSVNAFDDTRVARATEATGRKKLIFAGISLDIQRDQAAGWTRPRLRKVNDLISL